MKPLLSLSLACGKCGKPRGRHHLCRGGRKGRDRLKLNAGFTCGTCKKKVANPFTHTCTVRSDWARRRKAAERAEKARRRRERRRKVKADATRRRKAAAAERRHSAPAARRASRPRASPHNPRNCKEDGCQRYPCRLYAEGYADGVTAMEEV